MLYNIFELLMYMLFYQLGRLNGRMSKHRRDPRIEHSIQMSLYGVKSYSGFTIDGIIFQC